MTEPAPSFPADFLFGAATAAFQIEGASGIDGRTDSIWDTFCREPGAVVNGDDGAAACDHYHRYAADVALMARLGLQSYRFSTSWARVCPDGGPVNPAGLDFYSRLVDELLSQDIRPWLTLYHWDLPQALEDRGGWRVRDTAYRFVDYALAVHERLGDRVPVWTTLNEPWCAAFVGHVAGAHAPGWRDPAAGVAAMHHLLLGHGLAVQALREADPSLTLGITLNLTVADPVDPERPGDVEAARRIDGQFNRVFLDPLFRAEYPADVLADLTGLGLDTLVQAGDLAVIAAPIDVLGVNYYQGSAVSDRPPEVPLLTEAPTDRPTRSPLPAADGVFEHPRGLSVTDMGWEIQPEGLSRILLRLHEEYTDAAGVDLYVTENGAAFADQVAADGGVPDRDRTEFLLAHLGAVQAAMAAGVPVRGYFYWSLLDNFEWAWGYEKRFGIVRVDYATQERRVKDSGWAYAQVIATRTLGAPAVEDAARWSEAVTTPRVDGPTDPAEPTPGRARPDLPTLEMVAAAAGVSRATVSRVVNGSSRVRPQAVAAVHRAIDRLNYVPNRAARTLASRQTHALALLVPEDVTRFFGDPFLATVVKGITERLEPTNYILNLLVNSTDSQRKTQRYLRGGNVDGALVVSHHIGDSGWAGLSEAVPVVFGGRPTTSQLGPGHFVDVDNLGGGRAATRHLVEQGRRRIGTVTGPLDMPAAVDRLAGWRHELRGAGLPDDAVASGDFTPRSGAEAMRALLASHPELDAVFVASDLMARGALSVLGAAGRRVPDDVAVVGYDDSPAATASEPWLTTVAQPSEQVGWEMAEVLLGVLAGTARTERATILQTTLVVRETA